MEYKKEAVKLVIDFAGELIGLARDLSTVSYESTEEHILHSIKGESSELSEIIQTIIELQNK